MKDFFLKKKKKKPVSIGGDHEKVAVVAELSSKVISTGPGTVDPGNLKKKIGRAHV